MCIRVWAVVMVLMLLVSTVCAAEAQPYQLTLDGALAGKPLTVYLAANGGTIDKAFAVAPTFNKAWHEVDASAVKADAGTFNGPLHITVQSDGWFPKFGETLKGAITLAMEKNGAATYTGTVDGKDVKGNITNVRTLPNISSGRLILDAQKALALGKNTKNHHARITAPFADGKATTARIDPPGSIVDTSMGVQTTATALEITAGKMQGTMTALVTLQGADTPVEARYSLRGDVIGNVLAGTFTMETAGQEKLTSRLMGTIETPPANAGNALHMITLHELAGPGAYAVLHTSARDGKIAHGFGTTPNFNNATHDVDTTGLTLTDNKLGGTLKLTIVPDPWIPKDRKPIACELTVEATLQNGEWNGTYSGTANRKPVKGALQGSVIEKPVVENPTKAMVKAENGLVGGSEWNNRVFIGLELDGTKVTGGKISNNHTKLAGKVTGGELTLPGEELRATTTLVVEPGGGVTPGEYTIVANGLRVGRYAAGTFETFINGKKVKDGRFWASVETK